MSSRAPTRAQKVLRRTLVGASLASLLALILWGAHFVGSGWPILIAGATVLALAIFEVGRMGALVGRGLSWTLLVPALGVVLTTADATRAFYGDGSVDAHRWQGYASGSLASEYLWAATLVVIGFDLFQVARLAGRFTAWVRLVLAAALAYLIWSLMYRPADAPETHRIWFAAAVVLALFNLTRGRDRRVGLLIGVGFALWLVVPLPALTKVWYLFGESGLVALLILSKVGDIAGYFVGSAIGKSHPFPKISPGKTTAGCVASLVAGTAAGWVAVATGLLPQASWGVAGALLAGAGVNLAAQAGDLFESWVKRRAGVKDSGTWFGPSGGVLDLIDSLLFSIPAALWLWPRLFDSNPV